jgi:hypothetical protein
MQSPSMGPVGIAGQVVISTEDDEKPAVSQLVADLHEGKTQKVSIPFARTSVQDFGFLAGRCGGRSSFRCTQKTQRSKKGRPARICGCGLKKAHHGCKRRTLVTQAGEFTVSRIYLKCAKCGAGGYPVRITCTKRNVSARAAALAAARLREPPTT